jgi:hypothetical protein
VRMLGRFESDAPPAPGQAVTLAFRASDGGRPVPVFTPATV